MKASSPLFYSKIKGELEEHIKGLAFTRCIIFKPGMLLRNGTDRSGEKISGTLLTFLNRLGLLRKFKPLPTQVLAEKLAKAPRVLSDGVHTIELEKIWEF